MNDELKEIKTAICILINRALQYENLKLSPFNEGDIQILTKIHDKFADELQI